MKLKRSTHRIGEHDLDCPELIEQLFGVDRAEAEQIMGWMNTSAAMFGTAELQPYDRAVKAFCRAASANDAAAALAENEHLLTSNIALGLVSWLEANAHMEGKSKAAAGLAARRRLLADFPGRGAAASTPRRRRRHGRR